MGSEAHEEGDTHGMRIYHHRWKSLWIIENFSTWIVLISIEFLVNKSIKIFLPLQFMTLFSLFIQVLFSSFFFFLLVFSCQNTLTEILSVFGKATLVSLNIDDIVFEFDELKNTSVYPYWHKHIYYLMIIFILFIFFRLYSCLLYHILSTLKCSMLV